MIRVRENQSIFDITVQEFGQIDDVVRVSSDNNLSISDALETNRELIMNASGYGNNDIKKKIIEQGLSLNNDVVYSERKIFGLWHLPSKDELNAMYVNLHLYGVGGFNTGFYYWSSSETSATLAKVQFFLNGNQGDAFKVNTGYNVRACRSFTTIEGLYSLRDIGPSGGLIFYIDGTTFYEAFVNDQVIGNKFWSNITDKLIGTTGTAIDTGASNTLAIINQHGVGANDWFLPSQNELNAMYDNLYTYGAGNFTANTYWSSTESTSERAMAHNFSTGVISNPQKSSTYRVRACRSFTAGIGVYNLRDTGPAGGLIFYINGTTYYEAALTDQTVLGVGKVWSNVGTTLIGTTLAAIGEGQNNTDEIMAQSGHTDSSAKLCDDYDNSYVHTDSAAKLCNDLN